MALRNIVKTGDPILTKVCRPVEKFDSKLAVVLDDMYETMQKSNGVGLAGPQVGLLRRLCVIDVGDENGRIEFVNPVIVETSSETEEDVEGCLSFPGDFGLVERPLKVKVRAQDRNGEFFELSGEGLLARAMCHEIDHLDGVLFITKVTRMLDPSELSTNDDENAEE